MFHNTLCTWRCLRECQRSFKCALHDHNVLKKTFSVCLTDVWMFQSLEASVPKLEIHGSKVHTRNGEHLV